MRFGWLPRLGPVPETSGSMEASMCRWAVNIPGTCESALFNADETALAVKRREFSSLLEFATDEDTSASLGASPDATHYRRPRTARYLFNSMPCAYAWFHH
jgi:hypothetical protein